MSSSTVTVAPLSRTSTEAVAAKSGPASVRRASAAIAGASAPSSALSTPISLAATFCLSASPWSLRKRRISVIRRCASAMRRAASASGVTPLAVGQAATTTDSPPVSACHSDSVTNGITGCSRRSTASSTVPSTVLVDSARAPSAANCTLASSRYQSHSSSQAKW
ncbi:Uncharacterised protein [Mycobacteroides abscessus subsp. abscessus]|nr:Uncharacterised protein [Mycobacteroides abscessus subsp. abscessus]